MKRTALLSLALPFVLAAPLAAQFETATVLGYVRDSSGAFVPNATVVLIDEQTHNEFTKQTNAQGAYEFTDVKIGQYEVKVQAAGFDVSTTQAFTVTVNARQRVDVAVKAGSQTEVVTVTDAAALIETDSSERGQVIGRREVENLPLNGREYADLAALVPGVRRNILENQLDSSRDASFNVNGQRSEFNNFLLDGVDNNAYGTSNQGFSNQAIPASPDAISEFRVETDNYSAEYGRSAGAVINVSIRSGTNTVHGSAYDYLRNTVLNAIGPFSAPTNPLTGAPQKPILIRNQFGGTLGGPILRDRFFIFGDYEGNRQIQHQINQATVPTANQNGTSALAKANGGYTFLSGTSTDTGGTPVPILNPLTGQVYANGVIPFNDPSVSPLAARVLAALPAPNVPNAPFTNNYASLPADTINDNKGDVRADFTVNQKTTAFFRYSEHKGNILSPSTIQGPAGGGSANGLVNIVNVQYAGGVTHSFNQNAILDARFAYTHTDGGKSPYSAGLPSLEGNTPGLPTDPTVVRALSGEAVNGFTAFGNQTSNPQFQNPTIYNPKVNFTLIRGRNQFKFGYEYQGANTQIDDFNPVYGNDTYNGGYSYDQPTGTASSQSNTGIKEAAYLGDFIFGARDTYQLNNFVVVHVLQKFNFMYFQDDIRVNSKLTVNAGLRYELVTPQYEQDNKLANYNPATQSLVVATPGSLYNRALVNMQTKDFAPRFGFAYAVDNKTVVRSAFGITYAQFNREGGENLLVYNLPNIVNTQPPAQVPAFALATVRGSNAGLAPCTTAQAQTPFNPATPNICFRTSDQGFPTNFTNPANVTAASNISTQARYIPKDLPTGYVESYHLTVQRQIAKNTTFEVSYVGEHGLKLQVLADLNQAAPNAVTATCNTTVTTGCLSLQARRPIPTFTTIEETLPQGLLYYNSLQTKLEHRTGFGLYLLNSFTWSRAEDNASGHLDTPGNDNSRINLANPLGEIGPSAYNQPLNEVLSIVYDLPYGKGKMFGANAPRSLQEVLGGWQLTNITSLSSGSSFNISYSPNSFQQVSNLLVQRPNEAPGNPILPKSQRIKINGNQALITLSGNAFTGGTGASLFSLPTVNQPYGNAGRNSQRFDPFYNSDLGLHKQFKLYPEKLSFDFRVEAFNVFNFTNYAYPSATYSNNSGSFGAVTSALEFPPRQIQFAGKILF